MGRWGGGTVQDDLQRLHSSSSSPVPSCKLVPMPQAYTDPGSTANSKKGADSDTLHAEKKERREEEREEKRREEKRREEKRREKVDCRL
ncbi:hypothetical protein INR49_024259 [Caranx melampygus]|nr:hypothetical protein INR49_024259 [Caranx melampygus]